MNSHAGAWKPGILGGYFLRAAQEYEVLASKHLKVIIMLDDKGQTDKPNRLKKAIKHVSAMTINTLGVCLT